MRWLAVAALVAAGCSEVPFTCTGDEQCTDDGVTGWCEQNHRCSFPDAECESKRRYAPFGTDELCVPMAPACAVAGVAAGGNFTCAWSNAGRVSCWGENGNGQLGDGTLNWRSTAARASVTDVVEVVAGPIHACARHRDGAVSCWGDNSAQQLGIGDGMGGNRSTPVKLTTIAKVAALTAGSRHTCARLADGSARCWGRNASGQLGDGTMTMQDKPAAVPALGTTFKQLAAGNSHTCAALADGSVACWGAIRSGPIIPMWPAAQLSPTAIPGVSMAAKIATGDSHACALTEGGEVFCWGINDAGQAGDRALGRLVGATKVANVAAAVELAAGTNHTCARIGDGGARCWGGGASGQLGAMVGDTGNIAVAAPSGAWRQLAGGQRHTCALTDSGEVYCWGRVTEGQLGDGAALQWLMPEKAVVGLKDLVAIAAGAEHSCGLTRAGTVSCWGRGDLGQLASAMSSSSTPVAVALPAAAAQVVSGNGFSCARLADGSAHCWGRGNRGQIGDMTTTDHFKPAKVAILERIVHLAAGADHACAATMAGTVYCWGESAGGRLGTVTAMGMAQSKPLLVPLTGEFLQVGAGTTHACALSRTQQVTCWGSSTYGQAGVGPVTTPVAPTVVAGLPPVMAMAVGGDHACVITMGDGKVRCWGRGDSGQLGFGSTPSNSGLTQAVAIENFGPATAVAVASSHSCAIVGGVGHCWGSNRWGQLGSGKTASSNRPVAVVNLTNLAALDGGDRHTCAVLADGTGYCWGGNQWGQLGNDAPIEQFHPAKVALECP
jgi:alpha-tubulin suppressor-like RCC1 family protein